MRPLFLKKKTQSYQYSFQFQHVEVSHMYDRWHYHHEFELNLPLSGKGTRYVGDSIESFQGPDLVLLGPELPHVWKNDPIYYQEDSGLKIEVINIFFLPDFMGKDFIDVPEMLAIKHLFMEAKRGIKFHGKTREDTVKKMLRLVKQDGKKRFFELINLLHFLSESREKTVLSSPGFISHPRDQDLDKINTIYNYVLNNFRQKIYLEEVAELSNMSVAAFCRYFKNTTRKTFIQYVNEVRIGFACKLLLDNKTSITQICYESGFSNLSNFNRQFKRIKGLSPKDYKRRGPM